MAKRFLWQVFAGLIVALSGTAHATFHLMRITELFSNADGSVQFIQVRALSNGQQFLGGHTITSTQGGTTRSFTFPNNLPGETAETMGGVYGGMVTSYKMFLIATQGFSAVSNVAADYVVPNGFLFTTNGTVRYGEGADVFSYAALPTDGRMALYRDGSTGVNATQNFADETGSLNLSTPAIPNYTGAWFNAAESGWGMSMIRGASGAYGVIMYHYVQNHAPVWYFMSGGSFNGNVYTTPVLQFTGSWFGEPFGTIPIASAQSGTATVTFSSDSAATLSYTIGGVTVTRSIARLQF